MRLELSCTSLQPISCKKNYPKNGCNEVPKGRILSHFYSLEGYSSPGHNGDVDIGLLLSQTRLARCAQTAFTITDF